MTHKVFSWLLTSCLLAGAPQAIAAQAKSADSLHLRVIDLTHKIATGIPDFHGDPHAFQSKLLYSIPKNSPWKAGRGARRQWWHS